MDTARVDITYRPLRVAWAIQSTDLRAFRSAVRHSHTLWGGRFNPIVLVDLEEAADIVDTYRVDLVVPKGESDEVKAFVSGYPHLEYPFSSKEILIGDNGAKRSRLLDIFNGLTQWREQPSWLKLVANGLRAYDWAPEDPLADIFLMVLGAYPGKDEIGFDYYNAVSWALDTNPIQNIILDADHPINVDVTQHPSISYLSKHGLKRHHGERLGPDFSGFYLGDAGDIRDLVNYWNLCAADINVRFLDLNNEHRFTAIKPEYTRLLAASVAHLSEFQQHLAVWSRSELLDQATAMFPDGDYIHVSIDPKHHWKRDAIRPPTMVLGEESSLGFLGTGVDGQPKVSFALQNKPVSTDFWFRTQHFATSVRISEPFKLGEQFTFNLPYLPDLNPVAENIMRVQHSKLRLEPGRIGLVTNVLDNDLTFSAMPVQTLVERLFARAGIHAAPSSGGLIARQLIARMGGVDGTRAFKIGGVRQLIRTYGPTADFSKSSAVQIIAKPDPSHNFLPFSAHKDLFIEQRALDQNLKPTAVFEHLVAKGLFRIGASLVCPTCNLPNWFALDQLRQRNICDLCGTEFDATRQLVQSGLTYRRSGILGLEKNAQGAIPVALLLQQLSINLDGFSSERIFLPSFNLTPSAESHIAKCETDFVALLYRNREKTDILIGECKDAGGVIDDNVVHNMGLVADALGKSDLTPYIVFSKLCPFGADEISRVRALNRPNTRRVILLTAAELEPYYFFETRPQELQNIVLDAVE